MARKPDPEFFAHYLKGGVTPSGEQRAYCPLCEDPETSNSDSASFKWEDGVWHCKSCGSGGAIPKLRREFLKKKHVTKLHDPDNVTSINRGKELPTEEQIQLWHDRLMMMPDRLGFLTGERGLMQETVEQYLIGFDGQRYTIPVRDISGILVNVRRYNPHASKAADKMLSIEGHGQARILNPSQLARYDRVVLCEGEMDKFVGEQFKLETVTHTAGAGTFLPAWGPLFAGKEVYICYDCDDAGRKGAIKAAKILAKHADMVCVMDLKLDLVGGDITDFFVKQGNDRAEFERLMDEAAKHPIGIRHPTREIPRDGKPVTLEQTQSVEYGSEPLEMVVTVAGKQTPVYTVPHNLLARCTQDKGNVCAVCPMAALNGEGKQTLAQNDPFLLEYVDANNKQVDVLNRKLFGARCADRVEYEVEDYWSVEELNVQDSVEHRGEVDHTPIMRRVLNVGTYSTKPNSTARIVGRQMPDPASQRGQFLSWHLEQTQTDLDRFQMTPSIRKQLSKFQPKKGQTPLDKMRVIARDMAANVSHIYGRSELHIAYDLVWHSLLGFRFMGKRLDKGWLELLVVGDTRTGKSEAATQLIHHYNAGVLKSCEGSTFAGLVGGAQQLGAKWMVTWGVIPLNDRRIVVLDEMGGIADKDVIENMSSVRSSGTAQITKVVQAQTSARTRLIWIANPADGRRLEDVAGSGMTAIGTLVKNPEDIARFDIAMAASGSDVPLEMINTFDPEEVTHRYDSESCEQLILWAWSRKVEDVVWKPGAEKAVVKAAIDLGRRYVSEPPLVQAENVRVKVARLAAAVAARTFSTDETGEQVVIGQEHVESAVEFLDMIYGMESFGYARHSRKVISGRQKADQEKNRVQKWLREHNVDILHTLISIQGDVFRNRDFVDLAGMDQYEAQAAVRYLLEKRMVRRMSKGYLRMEPALITIINRLSDEEES